MALEIDSRLVLRTCPDVRYVHQKRFALTCKRITDRHYCIRIDRDISESTIVVLQFSIVRVTQSDLQQPAAQGDCHGVRAIVGSQFVDKILDVEVDGGFGDCQLICDLLVAIAIANQPQNL